MVTEEDILKASFGGEVRLNITEKTLRVFRGLRKLSFLNRLRFMASLMKRMKAWYQSYPASPQEFDKWKRTTHGLIQEAESKLKGKSGSK